MSASLSCSEGEQDQLVETLETIGPLWSLEGIRTAQRDDPDVGFILGLLISALFQLTALLQPLRLSQSRMLIATGWLCVVRVLLMSDAETLDDTSKW